MLRIRPLHLLTLGLLCLLFAPPSAKAETPDGPKTVQYFVYYLRQKDYASAYALLSLKEQARMSLQQFESTNRLVEHIADEWNILAVRHDAANQPVYIVGVQAKPDEKQAQGQPQAAYTSPSVASRMRAVQENGAWRLEGAPVE